MPSRRIDETEVRRIAKLARLNVTDDEIRDLLPRFEAIVDYFSLLESLPTQRDAGPNAGPTPVFHDQLRADVPTQGLNAAAALANAPDRDGDLFRVPAVLSDSSG
jgi:aspartyl-tRNA(Asn)/glutamyl-tRNA(Gln) amidotransferase subunit C